MTGDGRDPASPSLSLPVESLAERAADAAVHARLVEGGFRGAEFDEVANWLAGYAYPILCAWVGNGQIFIEAARRGARGLRSLGDRTILETDAEDLVQDTLVLALHRFAARGRKGEGWSPGGGASLATYFTTACVLAFVDVYRAWVRREREWLAVVTLTADHHHGTAADGSPDPADVLVAREEVSAALPAERRARAVVTLNAAGYSYVEIAQRLGTSPRAVEGLLRRSRQRRGKHRKGGANQ